MDPSRNEKRLAHLGVKNPASWSMELLESLYAVQDLPRRFAVLEVFGLVGDINLMVTKEPRAPELWRLPAVSFKYTICPSEPRQGLPADGSDHVFDELPKSCITGAFANDMRNGVAQLFSQSVGSKDETEGTVPGNVTLRLDPKTITVHVEEEASPGRSQCLTLPVERDHRVDPNTITTRVRFNGVEAIGGRGCNHFTYLQAASLATEINSTVDLWYSEDADALCALKVRSAFSDHIAFIMVEAWGLVDRSAKRPLGPRPPQEWQCKPVEGQRWLTLLPSDVKLRSAPGSPMPAARALGILSEAFQSVGFLPPLLFHGLKMVPRLRIAPLTGAFSLWSGGGAGADSVPRPSPGIFSDELTSFTFSFSSVCHFRGDEPASSPGCDGRDSDIGNGDFRVDLTKRRLHLSSRLSDVSSGIARARSEIIVRDDSGQMYAMTRLEEKAPASAHSGLATAESSMPYCWSTGTGKRWPAAILDGTANPPPAGNPFRGAKLVQRNVSPPTGGVDMDAYHPPVCDLYDLEISPTRHISLFVKDGWELMGLIMHDDLRNEVQVSVSIVGWSSKEVPAEWFEPTRWNCKENAIDNDRRLDEWGLLRVFLPHTAPPYGTVPDVTRGVDARKPVPLDVPHMSGAAG